MNTPGLKRTDDLTTRTVLTNPIYLIATFLLIFLAEAAIMYVLLYFEEMSIIGKAFLDSLVLTIIAIPIIHFIILRPIRRYIAERKELEGELLALKKAIETMDIGVTITDLKGRVLYCNPSEAEMHGYTVEELTGMEARLLSPESRWKRPSSVEAASFKSWKRDRTNIRKDGSSFQVQLTSNVVLDDDGKPIRIITNCEDITERKHTLSALVASEEMYSSLVNSTDDSIYVIDREFRYIFINRKHLSRLGLSKEEVLNNSYLALHTDEENNEFIEAVNSVFKTGKSATHEHPSKRDNRTFLRTLSPVKDRSEKVFAVTVISKDITELKKMSEDLRSLSLTDELTGLYNRRGFLTLSERELRVADRMQKGVYMLYADLDELKKLNDTYGHNEGDAALVETASILRRTFRESDIIARIGGDEFVVIPAGISSDDVQIVAKRLMDNINAVNESGRHKFKISMSFGISYYDPLAPCSLNELLSRADASMYESKRDK